MTKLIFNKNYKFNKLSLMKFLFYMMLMFSTLITINSSSWLNAWMGLEMNLMSFIPLMLNDSKNLKISKSLMMYFMIQAGASSMMILMIILMKMNFNIYKINLIMNCLQMSLLMKLGASPFHWWMPKIIINLKWMNCFILLTWQKIAPLFMLTNTNDDSLLYMSMLMSSFIGAIMGLNQSSLKLIMAYSSINHLGWILMNLMLNLNMLLIYFFTYSIITFMICFNFNNMNMNFTNQLFKNNNQNMFNKLTMISLFLSLGGLPPLLGFMPKLFTLILMIKYNLIMESMMFIILATISLSFYMNPLLSMLIFSNLNSKWNFKNYKLLKKFSSIVLMNMMLIMIIMTPLINNIL